jgi:hypothetical protein
MMYHLRQRSDNFFFKSKNPSFANDGIPPAEDPETLEYVKSQEIKYEPRKLRKTQNAYVRMEAVQEIRHALAQVFIDDLVEFSILSPSTFDFAMLLYKYCGNKFRCVDMVNQKWQSLQDEVWTDDIYCISELKRIMSEDLSHFYINKKKSLDILLNNNYISGEIAKPLQLKCQNLNYILSRLSAISVKNLILKDATEIFFYSEIFDEPSEN